MSKKTKDVAFSNIPPVGNKDYEWSGFLFFVDFFLEV